MTLQQLKYIVTVAEKGSISEAAKSLYITQPSLTASIRELEKQMNIEIFNRTSKGVIITRDGEEFLGYARQVLEQTNLIEERYSGNQSEKHHLCVSTQHYSFAVEAFVELLKEYGGDEYDFSLRETQTYEIIEDVARLRSEVGVLYLNDFNEVVIRKALNANNLEFHTLFTAKPHVFISSKNPLSSKDSVTLEDLEPYPRLSYEQGEHNAFYFAEEIQSTIESRKDIRVCDRATLFNMVIGLNGYTICSGVINETLNGPDIVAIPLDVEDYMEVGYITHKRIIPGKFAALYIEALRSRTAEWEAESNCRSIH